jgi:muramoyltetrapeptide carboxypeptidase
MRIAIVAASSRFSDRDRVALALAPVLADYPGVEVDYRLVRDVAEGSHFAGDDEARRDMLLAAANDPAVDAIWFARGGYGANRVAHGVLAGLDLAVAQRKKWIGYSDPGFLLAGLYASGCTVAHGPMPKDVLNYDGGAEAVRRSLNWLTGRSAEGLEPSLVPGQSHAAFNISVLAALLGTPLEPDLGGHVLMLEELDEHLYATDRDMFRIMNTASMRRIAGLRLGRVQVQRMPDTNGGDARPLPFDETTREIAERWCREAGIPFLGHADIGHDSANKVVPFGCFGPLTPL